MTDKLGTKGTTAGNEKSKPYSKSLAQLSLGSESDSDKEFAFANQSENEKKTFNAFGYVTLYVNHKPIKFLIDSGASVNIINESDFNQIDIKPALKPCTKNVFPYAQDQPLPFMGEFNTLLKRGKHCWKTNIYVSQSKSPSLIGRETSLRLGVIKFVNELNENNDNTNYEQHIQSKFPSIFQGVGKHNSKQIKLNVDDTITPVINKFRRVPFHMREPVEQELQRLEESDIIERIPDSEPTTWISPIVVVPKSSNSSEIRICIDMREPNTAIRRTRHVTPTVEDIQYKLNGAAHFSKLDLRSGYHQYELHPDSRHITTFATHIGLFRYKRLNFGVNAAAELFQREIASVIDGIPGALNISDDILVFGSSKQQHDELLWAVINRLTDVGLTLNKSKCLFNKPKLRFFGHIFSKGGMEADPSKIQEIDQLQPPINQGEVRSLLGMLNFCTRYISKFASRTKPLRDLLRKNVGWKWGDKQQQAFEEIMGQLVSQVKLSYFDTGRESAIWTDASPTGLGAILTQTDKDGASHIIAFGSRALTPAEGRYSQLEREALAIAWGIEHFNLYLYGSEFQVITDHKPLVPIFNNPRACLSARLERWRLRLQPYSFQVLYKNGKDNPADYMSRHPRERKLVSQVEKDGSEYMNFLSAHNIPKHLSIEEIRKQTKADTTLQSAMRRLQSGNWKTMMEPGVDNQTIEALSRIQDELSMNNDASLLFRGHRLILPLKLQDRAIEIAHGGHQGIVKTKSLLRQKVWFHGIDAKAEEKVRGCLLCTTATNVTQRLPLQPSVLPARPWSYLHLDHKGPLPTGEHLLVIVDLYTRFPVVEVVKSTSAAENIPRLEHIFSLFGKPDKICTDNGPPYNSQDFRRFLAHWGIQHRTTTPVWPQANGLVERFNKTLGKILKIAFTNQPKWKQQLNELLMSYRATPHMSTKLSPAELLFNRPLNIGLPENQELPLAPSIAHQKLKTNDAEAKTKYKHNFDCKSKMVEIPQEGDCVVVKRTSPRKTETYFDTSPYTITNIAGSAITATRPGHTITRNATHFKVLPSKDISTNQDHMANENSEAGENQSSMVGHSSDKEGASRGKGGHYNLRPQVRKPDRLIEQENI